MPVAEPHQAATGDSAGAKQQPQSIFASDHAPGEVILLIPSAGLGAAWLWQGRAGQPLSPETVLEMSNFLSPAQPRLRALGGSRFNTSQTPAPEWAEFGSYCFMLPRCSLHSVSASGRPVTQKTWLIYTPTALSIADVYCICSLYSAGVYSRAAEYNLTCAFSVAVIQQQHGCSLLRQRQLG